MFICRQLFTHSPPCELSRHCLNWMLIGILSRREAHMCERKQDTKMSLRKNVGSEKCSDMTGLFNWENIDYNGNICRNGCAQYSDEMAIPEVFSCRQHKRKWLESAPVHLSQTFRSTMTESLKLSPLAILLLTTRIIPMPAETNKNQCGFSLLSKTQTVGANW